MHLLEARSSVLLSVFNDLLAKHPGALQAVVDLRHLQDFNHTNSAIVAHRVQKLSNSIEDFYMILLNALEMNVMNVVSPGFL